MFETSYRLVPAPVLWVNIAQCLRRLGRAREAVDAYRRFLASRSGDAKLRAEIFEAVDELAPAASRRSRPHCSSTSLSVCADSIGSMRRAPSSRPVSTA
jgi:hypothetical protein